ncbi:MAG: ferredoxin-NADP reductase, partial [Candidatus Omnitrophica bacterium 4484_70.2]
MKIVSKEILCTFQDTRVIKMKVYSPLISKNALPGQFVVLMVSESGERIPLTIVDRDIQEETITLIFQEVGFTTRLLGKLNVGDRLFSLLGPLGHPTSIKYWGKIVMVGGGVGVGEILPVAKAFKDKGNEIVSIIGARTRSLIILEKELRDLSAQTIICTDDGSYGFKGFTTQALEEYLKNNEASFVYAAGPLIMLKEVSLITRKFHVKTTVSLSPLMLDATGMCGVCRVKVGGVLKFACIDGPEFDAHEIEWEDLLA